MQKFADFQLAVRLPPNPIATLDNDLSTPNAQLSGSPSAGRSYFLGLDGPDSGAGDGHRADGRPTDENLGFTCEGCHRLDPANGFYGTDGTASFDSVPQILKVAHLRNAYQKVGMFGMPNVLLVLRGDASHQGEQIRGVGFMHDGSMDTIFRFLTGRVFRPAFAGAVGFLPDEDGDRQRRDVEAFVLAFDSDLAPIVGTQVTLDATNAASVGPRIDLMIERASASFVSKVLGGTVTECEVVARTQVGGTPRGYVRRANGSFTPDDGSGTLSDAQLRALAAVPGQEVTYTCAPPGPSSFGNPDWRTYSGRTAATVSASRLVQSSDLGLWTCERSRTAPLRWPSPAGGLVAIVLLQG